LPPNNWVGWASLFFCPPPNILSKVYQSVALFLQKCVKTHLLASVTPKIFSGSLTLAMRQGLCPPQYFCQVYAYGPDYICCSTSIYMHDCGMCMQVVPWASCCHQLILWVEHCKRTSPTSIHATCSVNKQQRALPSTLQQDLQPVGFTHC
jgi:hypothetical protein